MLVDVVVVVVVVVSSSLFANVSVVVVVTFLFGSGVMQGTSSVRRRLVVDVCCRRVERRVERSVRQLFAVAVNRRRVVDVNNREQWRKQNIYFYVRVVVVFVVVCRCRCRRRR